MPSRYPLFDRRQLKLLPLSQREHDIDMDDILPAGGKSSGTGVPPVPPVTSTLDLGAIAKVAQAVREAKARGAAISLMMGAHVIKQGLSRTVIDLIRKGWVSVVACNGACAIHDYELARIGATSESVARYISRGQFGLWAETGGLNDAVNAGNAEGLGFGESLGRHIAQGDFPHKDASIFSAAWECGVPATVHVGIGYDIVHEHPNFDGAAVGASSYRDFLIFAKVIQNLEGGVLLCFGSAVMGPEVYLKALAMARNVAHQQGGKITRITSAVFDLLPLGGDLHAEAPKDSHEYYFRPYKTILVRTVKDGGQSYYIRGDHRDALPALHRSLAGE